MVGVVSPSSAFVFKEETKFSQQHQYSLSLKESGEGLERKAEKKTGVSLSIIGDDASLTLSRKRERERVAALLSKLFFLCLTHL